MKFSFDGLVGRCHQCAYTGKPTGGINDHAYPVQSHPPVRQAGDLFPVQSSASLIQYHYFCFVEKENFTGLQTLFKAKICNPLSRPRVLMISRALHDASEATWICPTQVFRKGKEMKKLMGILLSLASIAFVFSSAEAKTTHESIAPVLVAANAPAPQWGRRRGARVYTRSRIVRYGRRLYRETYQIRYLPNGRTRTRLISRVRIR